MDELPRDYAQLDVTFDVRDRFLSFVCRHASLRHDGGGTVSDSNALRKGIFRWNPQVLGDTEGAGFEGCQLVDV